MLQVRISEIVGCHISIPSVKWSNFSLVFTILSNYHNFTTNIKNTDPLFTCLATSLASSGEELPAKMIIPLAKGVAIVPCGNLTPIPDFAIQVLSRIILWRRGD